MTKLSLAALTLDDVARICRLESHDSAPLLVRDLARPHPALPRAPSP